LLVVLFAQLQQLLAQATFVAAQSPPGQGPLTLAALYLKGQAAAAADAEFAVFCLPLAAGTTGLKQ